MPQRTKLRSAVFSTLVVGMSLIFCLILVEYVVGYLLYSNVDERVNTEFDAELGWIYIPGTYRIKPDNSLVPHDIKVNEYGLRGGNWLKIDDGNTKRILVLGDSFTFAKVVREEDIYTTQLQNLLNENSDNTHEVLNAGVEGFGNAQQLHLMKRLAQNDITGDLVVLQLFTNDILDNLRLAYREKSESLARPGYILNDQGQLELEHHPQDPNRNRNRKKKGSSFHTFQVIRSLIETSIQSHPGIIEALRHVGVQPKMPRIPGLLNGWYDDEVVKQGIPLMKELIRAIRSEVVNQQANLLVMFIPSPLMIYPETYGPILRTTFPDNPDVDKFLSDTAKSQKFIRKICIELGVPYLDMYPVLLENNAEALYFPQDGHLTQDGHSIVAQALADKVREMDVR